MLKGRALLQRLPLMVRCQKNGWMGGLQKMTRVGIIIPAAIGVKSSMAATESAVNAGAGTGYCLTALPIQCAVAGGVSLQSLSVPRCRKLQPERCRLQAGAVCATRRMFFAWILARLQARHCLRLSDSVHMYNGQVVCEPHAILQAGCPPDRSQSCVVGRCVCACV